MQLHATPNLQVTSKEELRSYFLETFKFFESIFEVLTPEAFYIKSEPTRHPMIFYYGHTAVFYINKLVISGLLQERINPRFESLFAVGVDEMEWDDLENSRYEWPSVEEVKAYREKVKQKVLEFIEQTPLHLPITWENPFWIILMGCEHERIHIETSSVLHRQMPLRYIRQNERFTPQPSSGKLLRNSLVTIPSTTVKLGKERNDPYYGWDNEYGHETIELKSFQVAKMLVSNGEFLEFVQEGGYEKEEYWDEEGRAFLQKREAKHPHFWVLNGEEYFYRAYDRIIPLPLDFPVDVNALEAEAFCRWKSKKENKEFKLLSEAEYMAMHERFYGKEVACSKDTNVEFAHGFSSCAVDRFAHGEVYDVVGNAWCWSRTPIDGFSGFEVHKAYDDFSTPTFDGKHNLILGASWASSGNELLKRSRYAFRKHFFQHASFRYCISENEDQIAETIEKDAECVAKIKEEYLSEHITSEVAQALLHAKAREKALDMGCGCGRSAFELAKAFQKVEAIDFTARFIKVAVELKNRNYLKYLDANEIKLLEFDTSAVRDRVQFWQGDENNLKPVYSGYDFILYHGNSKPFLQKLPSLLNAGGVVVCMQDIDTIEGLVKIDKRVFQNV